MKTQTARKHARQEAKARLAANLHRALGAKPSAPTLPSILQSDEDERRRERNRDLEYESRLADEQEYGLTDNRPDPRGL